MRNHETQRREIAEQIALDELHERRGVGVDVVRAGGVEVGIAGRRHVDHRRHVELDHLLVERIPVAVGERRRRPVAARRIRIQIAAHESELIHAARELIDRMRNRNAGRLRQLADGGEVGRDTGRRRV